MWSYQKQKRFDTKGRRWHFVNHYPDSSGLPYDEQPVEFYFRDDERTEFGVLRFERRKDNPYRNYEVMVNKIMNDADFRDSLLDPETEGVWNRNWK
jgi:hypothetical protein